MSESKPFEIRASLLQLAKEVLSENAHMAFEAGRAQNQSTWTPVTTEQIVAEAEKLYAFVNKRS